MSQKPMTNYMPHSKKPKKKLDTWTIKYVYEGQRSIWTPDYDPENPPLEDCTEVEILNQRTGDVVTVKDDLGMMEFWKEIQGFTFEWKGGKIIQKRTIAKALKENGFEISRFE
ncbi:MAG: hypothetical protein V1850_03815 [Candidatus Bathyarchaeota archaeon]